MTGNGVTEAEPDIDPKAAREPAEADQPPRGAAFRVLARRLSLFILIPWGIALFLINVLETSPLVLPGRAIAPIERVLGQGLGQGSVTVGHGVIGLSEDWLPEVRLSNIALRDATGATMGQINEVRALVSVTSFMGGGFLPRSLTVRGAQLTIRRDAEGDFTISMDGAQRGEARDLSGVIDAIDEAFSTEPLIHVREASVLDLTVTLEDARSGRVWQVTEGSADFSNLSSNLELFLYSEIFNGTEDLASAEFYFVSDKLSPAAEFGAEIGRLPARDIASQAPALSLLSVLDAPVSGAITARLDDEGQLSHLDAALRLGAGELNPEGTAEAVSFRSAMVEVDYDPATTLLNVGRLDVEGQWLSLNGTARVQLTDFTGAWPGSVEGQVSFTDVTSDTGGIFEQALGIDSLIADVRVDLAPFVVDIGQAVATRGDLHLVSEGRIAAGSDGWDVMLDARSDRVTPDELMLFWPLQAADGARRWIDENVVAGLFSDVEGALRLAPQTDPIFGLSFAFADAEVRFLPDMPMIAGGRGQGAIIGDAFTMWLDAGAVSGGDSGTVSLKGSRLSISPLGRRRPDADITVAAEGELAAALTVLDGKPVRVLARIDRDAGIARAEASATANLRFPLKKKLPAGEVRFSVDGTLSNVSSDAIVPGRRVTADKVAIRVDPDGFDLNGPVRVDGLPMSVAFRQPFQGGREGLPPSTLTGQVPLGPAFLETFGIGLPDGLVLGEAPADVRIDIAPDVPPSLSLSSDLAGARLSIPALGWEKDAGTRGELQIAATLGDRPGIDSLRLDAAGLTAEGAVTTGPEGAFEASFSSVSANGWFDAPVTIRPAPDGGGASVTVSGGTIDLRRSPSGAAAGEGTGIPVRASLDRLILTDTITLTAVEADLVGGAGLSGRFQGRVNGRAAVAGQLLPQGGRTALRLTAADAGETLVSSGIFRSLDGGQMSLDLVPRSEDAGYDGRLRITNSRLRDQPAVVDFLDAVSIVGLLDQLRGPGIFFDLVEGSFRLYPNGVIIDEGAAIGASIGISLDGVHRFDTKQIDMAGVISPIYLVNAIGAPLTRRGEGLFGFTFRMTGTSDDPKTRVNPLSILAPGMLRDLFRRRPSQGQ